MSSPSEGVHVLCVDDDDALRALLTDMLERVDDRLAVDGVGDSAAVLSHLESGTQYDCVVCDFDMPHRTGLDVLDEIRESFPDLPFILYTGKGSEEIASEAISAGVTDYLQKGSGREHYELLANRIGEYADRYRADRQQALIQERYECLVEQSVVGIGLSQDRVFEYVNPKFAQLFGYRPEELVGVSVLDLIDESDRNRVRRAIEARESEEIERVHYVVTAERKSGERFDVEVSGSRVTYDGEPAVLGVVQPAGQDIAEQPRASAEGGEQAGRVDLAARCRRAWSEYDRSDDDLVVREAITVVANAATVDALFTQLLSGWTEVDRPLSMTLSADDGGFEVVVDPAEEPDRIEPPPDPPALGRTAELLGWDVLIASTDRGGFRYAFREVTVVE
ncbi:response regulator [Haloarcula litorea]|uniref:response regulator n=1 Tax=Haloarcula litorea TaxID=3032579 RepID=UPI0023E8B77D|nr:response regulator [Halomicroarcula sp. GDY20]